MSEKDTYCEELKTDVITLINQRAKLREKVEKQKLVIDELNENYLKLNAKFEAEQDKVEAAKAIMQEWFNSENWDESYDHEVLCRLDVVLNERKQSTSISQEQLEPTK